MSLMRTYLILLWAGEWLASKNVKKCGQYEDGAREDRICTFLEKCLIFWFTIPSHFKPNLHHNHHHHNLLSHHWWAFFKTILNQFIPKLRIAHSFYLWWAVRIETAPLRLLNGVPSFITFWDQSLPMFSFHCTISESTKFVPVYYWGRCNWRTHHRPPCYKFAGILPLEEPYHSST